MGNKGIKLKGGGFWKEIKFTEMRYENLLLLLAALIVFYALISPPYYAMLENAIGGLGGYGYLGVFTAGFFFAYGFTSPIAAVALVAFGNSYNVFLVALLGATGATISDFLLFKIAKKKLAGEIKKAKKKGMLKKHSKLVQHLTPLMAGFIIASPLPDEIGVAMLGASEFKEKKFLIFIFLAEFIGIFVLASVGALF